MDQLSFWWYGINYNNFEFSRSRYPSPQWNTDNRPGSRSYDGKVTSIESKPEEKKTVRVIDRTVVFSDVNEEIRARSERFLRTQATVDLAAVGAFSAGGFVTYQAHERKHISDIHALIGGIICVAGALFSLNRMGDASYELDKWSDKKFTDVCAERRRCGTDIDHVRLRNYRGSIVTESEVEDIWLKTIGNMQKDWNQAVKAGGSAVNAFLENFYSKVNPFNRDIVNYVYNKESVVRDPQNINRRYAKKDMLALGEAYNALQIDYRQRKEGCTETVCMIQAQASAAMEQVKKHLRQVEEIVEDKYSNCVALQEAVRNTALQPYRESLDRRIHNNVISDPFFSPDDKRKMQEEYNKDPNVTKIEARFAEEKKRCAELAKQVRKEAGRLYEGPTLEEIQAGANTTISMTKDGFARAVRNQHRPWVDTFMSRAPGDKF